MNRDLLKTFVENALREDIGDGDHSSMACIPENATGKAQLLVKEPGVLAGVEVAIAIFREIEPGIKTEQLIKDGADIQPGDVAFTVEGTTRTLLKTERLVLNVMQRMSGIATRTREYTDRLKGLPTKILDTRKTTPGMRMLEKEAVRIGGGVNHRMGLYDMIMLKDNHIDFAGGIEKAILAVQAYLKKLGKNLPIEVEVRSMDELREVMRVGGIHRIMLDNFSPEETREALKTINGAFETESSGGITLETLRDYAETGVDYISVGALTHHIKSLDLSLKAI
ncbi:carboxylating nicotinate-nucleotide diphosphorylase [Geofilum rubicundum]|uniref:Probable nicotinate-nucleotide pyrophosphorylase [carboxylating] n=1 Tax=Geofilum rubicundum JCM 15548 TaxID=1236989 RepID=A0A0E9LZH4_9BACT|nr:carboxylating nicotinate-nucleotide diphosphorylase [Geofilum rubicundum]GAO30962.1 quinolinate phosphoribosyltransferase [Geofilum rubicundum JCM 15548]